MYLNYRFLLILVTVDNYIYSFKKIKGTHSHVSAVHPNHY